MKKPKIEVATVYAVQRVTDGKWLMAPAGVYATFAQAWFRNERPLVPVDGDLRIVPCRVTALSKTSKRSKHRTK